MTGDRQLVRPRIVVTGMGVVSSAGAGCSALAAAVSEARCTLERISDPRVAHFRAKFAGKVREIPIVDGITLPPDTDRHIHLAVAAAAEALDSAGLGRGPLGPRTALVHATCSGPMLTIERQFLANIRGQRRPTSAEQLARRYDSGALILGRIFGIEGPTATVTTACSASTCAIGIACDLLGAGMVDCVLVGGADAFALSTLAGFDALRATCESCCAPFSKPVGMCLGEAAAYLVLETQQKALARKAFIRAEILGYGSSNDAYHCSAPDPQGRGAVLAMRRALADAGIDAATVTYVNAHGTGTESNDKAEARALRMVFGEPGPAVSATKSVTGHCLGAAGAIELMASILCGERGVLPPTANFGEVREGCVLNHVTRPGILWRNPRIMVSVNLAFGGHNAAVVAAVGVEREERVEVRQAATTVVISGCGAVVPRNMELDGGMIETCGSYGVLPDTVVWSDAVDLRALDRRLDARGLNGASAGAVAAAFMALRQASVTVPRAADKGIEVGLYTHTFHAPLWAERQHLQAVLSNNFRVERLAAFPYVVPNAVNGIVARTLGLTGHNASFCLGEGAGVTGLVLSCLAIERGRTPLLLSLALDEATGEEPENIGKCDGAVGLVLENSDHAQRRSVRPLAEVRGLALGLCNGSSERQRAEKLSRLIAETLLQGAVPIGDVGVVYGGGSHTGIVVEALRRVEPMLCERLSRVGYGAEQALACGDTLQIAYALTNRIVGDRGTKYILACLDSPSGYQSVVVLSCFCPNK